MPPSSSPARVRPPSHTSPPSSPKRARADSPVVDLSDEKTPSRTNAAHWITHLTSDDFLRDANAICVSCHKLPPGCAMMITGCCHHLVCWTCANGWFSTQAGALVSLNVRYHDAWEARSIPPLERLVTLSGAAGGGGVAISCPLRCKEKRLCPGLCQSDEKCAQCYTDKPIRLLPADDRICPVRYLRAQLQLATSGQPPPSDASSSVRVTLPCSCPAGRHDTETKWVRCAARVIHVSCPLARFNEGDEECMRCPGFDLDGVGASVLLGSVLPAATLHQAAHAHLFGERCTGFVKCEPCSRKMRTDSVVHGMWMVRMRHLRLHLSHHLRVVDLWRFLCHPGFASSETDLASSASRDRAWWLNLRLLFLADDKKVEESPGLPHGTERGFRQFITNNRQPRYWSRWMDRFYLHGSSLSDNSDHERVNYLYAYLFNTQDVWATCVHSPHLCERRDSRLGDRRGCASAVWLWVKRLPAVQWLVNTDESALDGRVLPASAERNQLPDVAAQRQHHIVRRAQQQHVHQQRGCSRQPHCYWLSVEGLLPVTA
jgi:hypothetical protein